MTARTIIHAIVAPATLLVLAGCGDGGGGIASTPTAPPPSPSSPLPPPSIGLTSDKPFAAAGFGNTLTIEKGTNKVLDAVSTTPDQAVAVTYRASDKAYLVTLPGQDQGLFKVMGYNGTAGQMAIGTFGEIVDASGVPFGPTVTFNTPGQSSTPYTYSSWGMWGRQTDLSTAYRNENGFFAYGVPTAPADIPTSGVATYDARLLGFSDQIYNIGGAVRLTFDFGAGTLAGYIRPEVNYDWEDTAPLGTYTFRDTVFAVGATNYSGAFSIEGLTGPQGSFAGSFTGPQGAETIARWSAPYSFSLAAGETVSGTMGGIWIGTKN